MVTREMRTRPPERAGVLTGGEFADQPAACPGGQRRIGGLTDQGVAEQPDLTGPVNTTLPAGTAAVLTPCCAAHRASNSSVITS
jgi:hypothetical protein